MTTLVTADLHWSSNPRDVYRHEFVGRLCKLLTKHKVRNLIVLGDLTEQKNNHEAAHVNAVVANILRLRNHCKELIIDCGNHDYENKYQAFFAFLGHMPNIAFVERPKAWDIPELGDCLILPHAVDYKKEWQGFLPTKKQYDWIFAHNTFDGAVGDNGRELVGIPTTIFNKGARVIAGDVHKPQRVGPVTYVGAPYLVDFGDDYTPRVLLIKDGEAKSIKVDGAQKRLVEISSLQALENVDGVVAGDMLKVRVQIKQKDRANWDKIKAEVMKWGESNDFNIWQVIPQLVKQEKGATQADTVRFVTKTDEQVMAEFAEANDIDERTLKIGHKIARKK